MEQLKKLLEPVKKYLQKIAEKYKKLDKKKRLYLLAAFAIVFIMSWAFISAGIITCNFNREQLRDSQNEQKVNADGIIITETKEGKKYFEIYGEIGNYNNEDRVATLHNVVGNFYKNNEVTMSFQSSKGTYDEQNGTIRLYKNTYIVLQDNTSLSADSLVWSGSDKETVAEGNVVIKKNDEFKAVADKCIIGVNYEKFKIIGKTQTKVYGD